jgi:CheY-like chemotaxis protein
MMMLFVEDETAARRGFAEILSLDGHDVVEAADGEEAIRYLADHRFDVVVLDIRLPKVSGLSLVRHIRAKWPDTAVLLISAYLEPSELDYLFSDKVAFLPKPLDTADLIATLNRLASVSDPEPVA